MSISSALPLAHQAVAIAIMGGLTVATLLTIFFVPALYAAWFRVGRLDAGAAVPVPAQPALAT